MKQPAIKARANALIDKALPAVVSFFAGSRNAGLLSGDIDAKADALINEIEAVMPVPLKESPATLR